MRWRVRLEGVLEIDGDPSTDAMETVSHREVSVSSVIETTTDDEASAATEIAERLEIRRAEGDDDPSVSYLEILLDGEVEASLVIGADETSKPPAERPRAGLHRLGDWSMSVDPIEE